MPSSHHRKRAVKVSSKVVRKHPHQCQDGPWKGFTLYLSQFATLVVNINGQVGRYNDGKWEPK